MQAEMKRMLRTLQVLAALSAVLLTVLLNWQGEKSAPTKEVSQHSRTVVKSQDRQHREATLTDAARLYRVCSSRPQRIMPTHGSKNERTVSPCSGLVRRRITKFLHTPYDGRRRLETAPFCLSASRDYYVIALRHIIR